MSKKVTGMNGGRPDYYCFFGEELDHMKNMTQQERDKIWGAIRIQCDFKMPKSSQIIYGTSGKTHNDK